MGGYLADDAWQPRVEGRGAQLLEAFYYDEDDGWDENWSSPSDACTENNFGGKNDFDQGRDDDDEYYGEY